MLRRVFALYVAGHACAGVGTDAQAAGDPLRAGAERFQHWVHDLRRMPAHERAAAVNSRVNASVGYRPDAERCDGLDCWQTPAETLASGQGDCEDYAIAKYFLLDACGGDASLRLVYAHWWPNGLPAERLAHVMLLADAQASDPLVLDCLAPALARLSSRHELAPLFSFDAHALWRGVGPERVGDAPLRLRRWREVLQRWAAQQQAAGATH